ncbi:Peroxisomal membrane protein [Heracleum sosnowskyi]|uniref:Peroxisomal membrane protein n=1 Tax=Heracleum sosnowskyi TaxID=360622 RepID=A0AAD8J3W3_9APIA|nr:Peroxisomal membrane protein [Heracleum sosnowskyi]
MESLGFNIWGMFPPFHSQKRKTRRNPSSKSNSSVEPTGPPGFRFPIKQAATAGALAVTGDTLAQLRERWVKTNSPQHHSKDDIQTLISDHNWLRSLRMASYGFLLYGPGSFAWYQFLERCMPKQTVQNILIKVLLNQIVLGPCVIAVVFAWNNLWLGKLSELPNKYQKDALRSLLFGFRFWVPVSVLNFWVVPLQARVAFMSMGSIFWNFWLSSTMIK